MKEINVKIKLYKYEELNEVGKEHAFEEHFDFLCSNPSDYEDENGDMVFQTEEDYTREIVEESININEYLFFIDGNMADTIHYVGKHEKAGITEFTFGGEVYEI